MIFALLIQESNISLSEIFKENILQSRAFTLIIIVVMVTTKVVDWIWERVRLWTVILFPFL